MKFKQLSKDEIEGIASRLKDEYGGDPLAYFPQNGQMSEEVIDGIGAMGWELHRSPELLIVAAAAVGFEMCKMARQVADAS